MVQKEINNVNNNLVGNGLSPELKSFIPGGERGICNSCGCTWNNACVNALHGSCWWIDVAETMCSHCHFGFSVHSDNNLSNFTGAAGLLETYLTSFEVPQRQLARELGISQAHISNILKHQVFMSERLAKKIEEVTGISARKLLIMDMEYKLHLLEQGEIK
ncbi:helix-turn-helix transcriptional regulator [Streptococcus suis]|uniref:helix-turn-helix transcriptional regulator n=1 Tax=Streptococcus suis TaxID=1307 RepID=UPI0038BC3732